MTRGETDVTVTLTATLTLGEFTTQKEFTFTVKALEESSPGENELLQVKNALTFDTLEVEENFELPLTGDHGVSISWTSDNSAIEISGNTAVVTRGETDVTVTLTATLTLGEFTTQKEFTFTVKALEKPSKVTVKFFVTIPENTPMEDNVIIAGNFGSGKPLWDPSNSWGIATRVNASQCTFELVYED